LPQADRGDSAHAARPTLSPCADGDSLSCALEGVLERLPAFGAPGNAKDGILFSGNRHDSVPRRLYLDRRLTPLERNAWALVRFLLREDGVSAMPTYEDLRPYLATTPCAMRASEETVARALAILRLTRWLSLVRHRRDRVTGRFEGSLYVLHDEPLTPYEALQLDPNYLELVGRALTHASKAVRDTGHHTLKEISEDPQLSGRRLPTRLQLLIERLASSGGADEAPSAGMTDESAPEGPEHSVPSREERSQPRESSAGADSSPSSESEGGSTPRNHPLRNPKTVVRTVRTDLLNKEIRTVPRAREEARLRLPDRLAHLRPEQREGALTALCQVDAELQQLVLDEWAARCQTATVRNPAAYLFGLIQRALRGEFRAWASSRAANAIESGGSAETDAAPHTGSGTQETQSRIAALTRRMRIR
jgi:hypothetical protein